jgi:hypothetical protein
MPRVSGGYHGHGYSLGVEIKPDGSAHCCDCNLDVPVQDQLDAHKCTPNKPRVQSLASASSTELIAS